MPIGQAELNRFFEIIAASKLPSELTELFVTTSNGLHLVIQDGTNDALKIKIPLLRGIKGDYDADTNTPALIDGTGTEGDTYYTTVAGSNDYGSGTVDTEIGSVLFYISGKWRLFNEQGVKSIIAGEGIVVDDTDPLNPIITANVLSKNTGDILGGVVTADGAFGVATTFSVTSGSGFKLDWTDPSNPIGTPIAWPEFTNQSIPNIATELFTTISIQESATPGLGELVLGNTLTTPEERRSLIGLQGVVHTDLTTITSIGSSSKPAYEITEALLDYIVNLGPLNDGNQFFENGANLSLDKTTGQTTFPFINRDVNTQNPTEKTNIGITLGSFTRFYRNGSGGFTIVANQTVIDPEQWDDGSGVLATVSNPNPYTIKRIYFFGQTGTFSVVYGQAEYGTLGDARANIFLENPEVNPVFQRGTFVTALIVRKGITDLTAAIAGGDAEFVPVTSETSGGGAGAVGNFITQDTDQLTGNTGNKTLDGDWRFNNNLSLGATSPTYKLEIEDAGGDFIKLTRNTGDVGSWQIQISSALGGGTGTLRFIPSVSTADFHVLSDGGASRFIIDTSTGNATVSGVYISGGFTVATLPAGITGATAYVTDALTPSYLGTAVGGGAVTVPVFYNGTNWIT